MKNRSFVIILTFIGFFIKKNFSISCYDCNSENNKTCGDAFEESDSFVVDCSSQEAPEYLHIKTKPVVCRKIAMKVNGKNRVYRGCGFLTSPNDDTDCLNRIGTHKVYVSYCSCTKDLCNNSHSVHQLKIISYMLLIVSSIITINI